MNEYECHDCQDTFEFNGENCKECPVCHDGDINEITSCCGEAMNDVRICPNCKEHC